MKPDNILMALLYEIALFADAHSDDPFALADLALFGMRQQGVTYRPELWHGTPMNPAQRMATSRAVRSLEQAGLVERVTEIRRDRVRFVRPTVAGLARALDLASDVNPAAVLAGLRRTAWGASLADELDRLMATQGS